MDHNHSNQYFEEPFLIHELILGLAVAIGMLLTVAVDSVGIILVLLAVVAVSCIYLIRIYRTIRNGEEVVICCFSWLNNLAMILAAGGILMLMLMSAHHRPVFFASLGILAMTLLLNSILLRYNIKGIPHITAQLRLVIALVILLVFFLL